VKCGARWVVDCSVGGGDGKRSKTGPDGTQVLWDGRERITKRARGSCTLQYEEQIGRRQEQQQQQQQQKICWGSERRRGELEMQSRLEMTAEAGALSRYQKPIWTAGLQCVVLPWITPSGGRQAAVRTEDGGRWENDSLMGRVHVLGTK
jgi:hypothetical protein